MAEIAILLFHSFDEFVAWEEQQAVLPLAALEIELPLAELYVSADLDAVPE
jgi:hypothetical protein